MKTVYTDILRAALKAAEDFEKRSVKKEDKQEWRKLNRTCRKELYKLNQRIDSRIIKN